MEGQAAWLFLCFYNVSAVHNDYCQVITSSLQKTTPASGGDTKKGEKNNVIILPILTSGDHTKKYYCTVFSKHLLNKFICINLYIYKFLYIYEFIYINVLLNIAYVISILHTLFTTHYKPLRQIYYLIQRSNKRRNSIACPLNQEK